MKKLLLVVAVAISSVSFAQSGAKEDVAVIQSLYGKEKQELVKTYMKLEGTQAAAFEKVYDKYEAERKLLGKKRMELIGEYADHFETLTDAKADAIVKATLKNNIAYENLYLKYFEQAKKAIGTLNAAKFIQLENALQTAVKADTQDAIPFIGEIDRTKKN